MTKRSKRSKEKKIKFKESPKEVIIKTKAGWLKKALVNKKKYEKNYNNSIKNNDAFWKKEGKRITWIKPYKKIKDVKYSKSEVQIKWYEDGTLNASENCIDRHLKNKKFVAVKGKVKEKLKNSVSLVQIKKNVNLKHLSLIKQSRLSVMPIDFKSWKIIHKMSKV